ncbi:MAG: DNA-binding response regulator [Flavobacteriia bacterium]|nr:MAG: DNA-binding response regulator [Flavobacteriia bacterium]
MRVIIIEDEKPAARRLARMLKELGIEAEALLHSVKDSMQWLLENSHPDLILLDIQLSDGLSFEIFEEIEVKSAIIFTTAYDEYALKAFKLNSIDYLLKPIDIDELKVAVDKFKANRISSGQQSFNLDQIRKLLVNPLEKTYKKRFTVKLGQHLKMIPVEEVVCFYSENKGTYIHTAENRDILLDCSVEQLEEQVDPAKFFRISRKYLINIDYIKDIIAYTNSRLQLKLNHFDADDIVVSREKVRSFKTWLG